MHFSDGMIYFDKIAKAGCQKPRKYIVDMMNKDVKSEEAATQIRQIKILFQKYVLPGKATSGAGL